MRTSVCQCYLTVRIRLPDWVSPLNRPTQLSKAACSEYARVAISR